MPSQLYSNPRISALRDTFNVQWFTVSDVFRTIKLWTMEFCLVDHTGLSVIRSIRINENHARREPYSDIELLHLIHRAANYFEEKFEPNHQPSSHIQKAKI